MVGLKRRRMAEGWEIEVSGADAERRGASLRDRLANNNWLWIACVGFIVLVALFSASIAKRSGGDDQSRLFEPAESSDINYNDEAHRQFAQSFQADKAYRGFVLDAGFSGPNGFRITVRANANADYITDLSQMACVKILSKFKQRVVTQVYVRRSSDGREILAAMARWVPDEHGFVVKLY